jgi:hypothetical protein
LPISGSMEDTMTDTIKGQRVWLELELPYMTAAPKRGKDQKGPLNHALGHTRAQLANNMITRLQDPKHRVEDHLFVWWNETKFRYCFSLDSAGSFVEASDHGHWFNLEYFGRPLD